MPITRQKIGRALSGFGAGVAGRGPQFLERLDEERSQAVLEDAFSVQQHLQRGDVGSARTTLINRLQAIEQLGGNPKDTDALLLKLERGDIEGVQNDVNTVVDFGVRTKRLTAPTAGGQGFTLSPGQTRFGPGGGEIASLPKETEKKKGFSILDSEELEAAGLPPGTFAQRDNSTNRIVDISLAKGGLGDVRQATPAEIKKMGFPEGTFAQIKPDKSLFNIREPKAPESETKPFASMGGENRVKLGLIANANQLLSSAQFALFDEKGRHRGVEGTFRGLDANLAKNDAREGLMNMLRAVSGAAIPEEEIAREVDNMLPDFNDTNDIATAKWARALSKVRNLHVALTGGFTGVPDELTLLATPFSTMPDVTGNTVGRFTVETVP